MEGKTCTFYISYNEKINEVTTTRPIDILSLFHSNFPNLEDINDNLITFELKDKEYDIIAKLDDPEDIYEGAVVNVKIPIDILNKDKRKHGSQEKDELLKRQKPIQSQRFVVLIRGVPWDAGRMNIREFFKGLEILDDGICLITKNPESQHHTGEAFIEFKTEEDLNNALKKDREKINTRYIEIYKATGQEFDNARHNLYSISPNSSSNLVPLSFNSIIIKLSGIPYRSIKTDVIDFLKDVNCIAVHFPKDQLGRSSGDAFVEVENEENAIKALKHDRMYLGKRFVDISRSTVHHLMSEMSVKDKAKRPIESFCLKMRGLPSFSTNKDINDFFGYHTIPIHIHKKVNGSEAFCEFATKDEMDRALSKDRKFMNDHHIELFRVSYFEMAHEVGLPISTQQNYINRDYNYESNNRFYHDFRYDDRYNSPHRYNYGINERNNERVKRNTVVRMLGLPYRVTRKEICDFFHGFNYIPTSIDINLDSYGRTDGTAIIEFASYQEAKEAVEKKNRDYIGKRYIELRIN